MPVLLFALPLYALGLVLTAVGSRLAGRCATWCFALCGFPMWVVGGTVAAFCVALPQLVLAFLAAGLGSTGLAVGVALAGAVADIGLALALCLLRRDIVVDRREWCGRCALLLAAAGVLALFVRGGRLSYTGTGLLMLLFTLYTLYSIACQYRLDHSDGVPLISTHAIVMRPGGAGHRGTGQSYNADTMEFPIMNAANAAKNLAGSLGGLALLAAGAWALLRSATALAATTGTTQALWAATLISLGFCLPLLAEVLRHPFGTVWKRFAVRCRYYPPRTLPMQLLGSAILDLTLVLPFSSLMYRDRLPVGAQFRRYDVPLCAALALALLLPPALKKRLYRGQGAVCLAMYIFYLAIVLVTPDAGA